MDHTEVERDLFLEKLRTALDANLTNEQFGVEDLAKSVCMSRSQLHRKLQTTTGQSASQFIREHRLELGMRLLREGSLTAAGVADRVGFGSATYFNKCFNEFYGFPPGEVKNRPFEGSDVNSRVHSPMREAAMPRGNRIALVATIAITLVLSAWIYIHFGMSHARPGVKSIAIMPFANISENPGGEYFSEGVVEAIRTRLSHIRELRVLSATAVERYRKSGRPASEIAADLGVDAWLEGSVQRNNKRVRIDVRLVDRDTESLIWAQSFDRHLENVFDIQNEIARQVADELHGKLSPEEASTLASTDTDSPEAYDLFLKGLYEYRTYTNSGTHHAIDLFSQAVALDPHYAKAYAFLANSYFGLATIFGAELSALEALERGKPYLDKALELDPDLSEAHMLRGFYLLYHDWNFDGAEAEYKVAIASGQPDAISLYVDFLNFMSRHKEALALAQQLDAADPYYPNSRMTQCYIFNRRMNEALEFSNSRLKLFGNYLTLDSHGFLLLNLGRYEEAIVFFDKAMKVGGIRHPRMLGWTGAAYARSGNRKAALGIIEELHEKLEKKQGGSVAFFIAVIYAALQDKSDAILWLRRAYESHDMEMPWLMTEPQLAGLRKDPEFQRIASAMHFH